MAISFTMLVISSGIDIGHVLQNDVISAHMISRTIAFHIMSQRSSVKNFNNSKILLSDLCRFPSLTTAPCHDGKVFQISC
jgi:hypothetical protein